MLTADVTETATHVLFRWCGEEFLFTKGREYRSWSRLVDVGERERLEDLGRRLAYRESVGTVLVTEADDALLRMAVAEAIERRTR